MVQDSTVLFATGGLVLGAWGILAGLMMIAEMQHTWYSEAGWAAFWVLLIVAAGFFSAGAVKVEQSKE